MTATRRPQGAARLAKTFMRTGHLHYAVSRPRSKYIFLERQYHFLESEREKSPVRLRSSLDLILCFFFMLSPFSGLHSPSIFNFITATRAVSRTTWAFNCATVASSSLRLGFFRGSAYGVASPASASR
jgi:hypothetical protein